MKIKLTVFAIAVALLGAGCEQGTEKQTVGTLVGAAGGGLLGAQFGSGTGQLAATAIGALGGAFIGNQVGKSMDQVDRMKAQQAIDQSAQAPIGQTITWNNPKTGNSGSVTAVRDGTSSTGEYCREYQQTITVGGKTEQAFGTACRQPDGSWQIVK
jgi:surface antigen